MIRTTAPTPLPRPLLLLLSVLAAGLVLIACERDYDNPFDPKGSNYAGEEWTRDSDGDGIADSVELYAPGCRQGPDSCLAQARRAQEALASLGGGGNNGTGGGDSTGDGKDSTGGGTGGGDTAKARLPDSVKVSDMQLTAGDPAASPSISWFPSDVDDKRYRLISDNSPVAKTEGEGGKVKPLAAGTAQVTLITESGKLLRTFTVTVKAKSKPNEPQTVRVISVTAQPLSLLVGEEKEPVLSWNPGNAADKAYSLSSQDAAKAEIRGGKVLGKAPGTTHVIVTARDGGKTATFTVSVIEEDKRIRVVSIAASDTVLALGQEAEPRIAWTPADATDRSYRLMSSDPGVVSVQDGRLRAAAPGTSVVLIQANDDPSKSAAIKVRVVVPVGAVSAQDMAMTAGDPARAPSVSFQPAQATDRRYRLASDNPAVAGIEGDTLVRPVAPGNARITVTSVDGARTAAFRVTVSAKTIPVESIAAKDMEFVAGDAPRVAEVAFTPADATERRFRLASGNPAVAAVEGEVTVRPAAPGTTTVTATSLDGGKTTTFRVTVAARTVPVQSIAVADMVMETGSPDRDPEITWTPADATDKSYTLVSPAAADAAAVAVAVDNKVRAVKAGEAFLQVTPAGGGRTVAFKVTVIARVQSVQARDMELAEDTRGHVPDLVFTPADASDKGYTLTSSDTDKVSVQGGTSLRAKKPGQSTITVTTRDGGRTATFTARVFQARCLELFATAPADSAAERDIACCRATGETCPDRGGGTSGGGDDDGEGDDTVDSAQVGSLLPGLLPLDLGLGRG